MGTDTHWEEGVKRDEAAETVIEADAEERKYTAITFMIKYSVQFNSNLDGPVRANRVRGRILTDV